MTNKKIINKLEKISKEESRSELEREVATMVISEVEGYDKAEDFFSDLQQSGCQSGMISELIYYTDTHAFFDRFYDDIDELREDLEDNLGEALQIKGDLKNFYAWLAFEETAFRLAREIGLEL